MHYQYNSPFAETEILRFSSFLGIVGTVYHCICECICLYLCMYMSVSVYVCICIYLSTILSDYHIYEASLYTGVSDSETQLQKCKTCLKTDIARQHSYGSRHFH